MSEKEDVYKKDDSKQLDDAALEKLAVEELMREAVQGAARAEVIGPSGWVPQGSQPKTNKRFLVNTIRHAVFSNNLKSSTKSRHRSNKSPKRERRPESTSRRESKRRQ